MKAYLKFKAWLQKTRTAIVNNSVYLWLFYRLNIRRAIVLVILLNLATVINGEWFNYSLNTALALVGYFDYKGYLEDRVPKK